MTRPVVLALKETQLAMRIGNANRFPAVRAERVVRLTQGHIGAARGAAQHLDLGSGHCPHDRREQGPSAGLDAPRGFGHLLRMLTLYLAPGASSMATHIALHEVGVPFEIRLLSFKKQEMQSPEYLAINPEGKVPTLVIDGRPMTEVAANLFYLARRYPAAHLLPDGDIEAEAQVVSWMSFLASTVHPGRRSGVDRWREVFGIADRRLGGREWAIGRYTIADIHLFRLYWRFQRAMQPAPADHPGLAAHFDRMLARPAVLRTIEVESALGYELP